MKKIFATMVVCLMAMALITSCGGSNTPSSVADKAYTCLKKNNFKGFAKLVNASAEEQNEVASMLEEKAKSELEEKGGIKDFSVVSEDVDEEEGSAEVTLNVVYGNGEETTEYLNLERNDHGDWRISLSL